VNGVIIQSMCGSLALGLVMSAAAAQSAATAPSTARVESTTALTATATMPAIVLGAEGRVLHGVIVAIDDKGVALRNPDGNTERVPWSTSVGLITEAQAQPALTMGMGVAMLASGERLPGVAEANASGLRWVQRALGAIELPTTELRWVSFDGAPPIAGSVDADVVRLRTGDRLEGFVSSLADPLVLEARTGGTETKLPLAGVQSIAFVTPEAPKRGAMRRVWLIDGSVIDASSVVLQENGSLRLEGVQMSRGPSVSVPLMALAAIAGDQPAEAIAMRSMQCNANEQSHALRYQVTPPDRMEWPSRRPRMASSPTVGSADDGAWPLTLPAIGFDGPATLRIDITEPAVFVGRLVVPRDRILHGCFEVIMRTGGREHARTLMDASRPAFDFVIEVEPPSIEIEIVDVGDGAVQDGLVIERGALIRRSAPASSPDGRSDGPSTH